ncbi:MAG: hypothetical protein IPN38_20775 [Flavobacteriales bacterium]|nr:hypothetical protein [Flavobacteriales bacterium]
MGSCKKEDTATPTDPVDAGPRLILKFAFDSTQVRLNGFGQPSTVPVGHGAQCPKFQSMSAHYGVRTHGHHLAPVRAMLASVMLRRPR